MSLLGENDDTKGAIYLQLDLTPGGFDRKTTYRLYGLGFGGIGGRITAGVIAKDPDDWVAVKGFSDSSETGSRSGWMGCSQWKMGLLPCQYSTAWCIRHSEQ
jgi:hypothetical protein